MEKDVPTILVSSQIRLGRRKSLSAVKRDEQRWLRDLKLVEWGPRSLFSEYLEMGSNIVIDERFFLQRHNLNFRVE